MYLKSFLLLSLATIIMGFATPDKFILNGTLDLENGEVTLRYLDTTADEYVTTKALIHNGKFTFEGELNEPAKATLTIGNRAFRIYVEPCRMEMEIGDEYPQGFEITGSKVNDDAAALFKMTESLQLKSQELSKNLVDLRETMSGLSPDSDEYKALQSDLEGVFNLRKMTQSEIQKIEADFIYRNPDSYVSLYTFSVSMQDFPIETQRKYFDNLAPNLKTSRDGKMIDKLIKMEEDTVVGMVAPDFSVPDMNGDTVTLSSYRGKSYVLLAFWGQMCAPCKASFPYIKNIYEKYSDKLDVIFIYSDFDRNDWLESIEKCDIGAWPQVLAFDIDNIVPFGSGGEVIGEKYPTIPVPIYILIDKTGKIVLRDEGFYKNSTWPSEIETILNNAQVSLPVQKSVYSLGNVDGCEKYFCIK